MHTSLSGCDLRDHMPLVRDIVKRIAIRLPFSVELTELEKRGVTGLRIAAEEYDSTRGCSY